MSMLTIGHNELANHNKIASDNREVNTNNLTYGSGRDNSSVAIAIAHKLEDLNAENLSSCSDTDYFNNLM